MSVVTEINRTDELTTDGAETEFDFDMLIHAVSEVEVHYEVTGGDYTQLVLNTNYTVVFTDLGGTVTTIGASSPYAAGKILIIRHIALTQQTKWINNDNHSEGQHQDDFDRSSMRDIQIQEALNRSVKFATTSDTTDIEFPEPSAGEYIAWNDGGTALQNRAALTSLDYSDSNFIVGDGSNWIVESGATVRSSLGLVIGTDILAYDTGLQNLAGVAMAANKFYYTSGDNVHVAADVTAFARSILDDANEATFKATVNLEIGTDVLAQQTIGIADNNLLEVDGTPNSGEYARFTANGLEGRTLVEMAGEIDHGNLTGLDTGADHSYIDQDVTNGANVTFGTIGSGVHTITANNPADNDFLKIINSNTGVEALLRLTSGGTLQLVTDTAGITLSPAATTRINLNFVTSGALRFGAAEIGNIGEPDSFRPLNAYIKNDIFTGGDITIEGGSLMIGTDSLADDPLIEFLTDGEDGLLIYRRATNEWEFSGGIEIPNVDTLTIGNLVFGDGTIVDTGGDGAIVFSATDFIDVGTIGSQSINMTAGSVLRINSINVLRNPGTQNFFVGDDVFLNADGVFNVGVGYQAGYNNSTVGAGSEGEANTYVGWNSGRGKATENKNQGRYNATLGGNTLYLNSTGYNNCAVGYGCLRNNTTGYQNLGVGHSALYTNAGGHDNAAFGQGCLYTNTSGNFNVGFGTSALISNSTGSNNIAIGYLAGQRVTSSSNVLLGNSAGNWQVGLGNRLIIDNQTRGSAANEITDSLIYGIFSATPANQSLRINGEILGSYGAKFGDGGATNYTQVSATGDLSFVGTAGLIFGHMYIPSQGGNDITVSLDDANPHEVLDDGTVSENDGWVTGELNEVAFAVSDLHYLTVPKIGKYKVVWSLSGHTAIGGGTVMHGGIMVNNVAIRNNGEDHATISNSTDVLAVGSIGTVDIESLAGTNAQISLWISDDNSTDIVIEHGNMYVEMIGGT